MEYNNTGQGHPLGMEETAPTQNGNNWPFSVRYTASPYRKPAKMPIPPHSPYSNAPAHPTFDPNQGHVPYSHNNHGTISMNQHILLHHQQNAAHGQAHSHHIHSINNMKKRPPPYNGMGGVSNNHHHPRITQPSQNHFLDLKQHQEHQQHLIHFRQRQYDHHHYGLPLNLNVKSLPPEVILQASQATINKTMEMDHLQRLENLQNLQNLEAMQLQQYMRAKEMAAFEHQKHMAENYSTDPSRSNGEANANSHFRMRYPPITPRKRVVVKMNGNVGDLEQVEGLDEGYIEELKLGPSNPTNSSTHVKHPTPSPQYPQSFHPPTHHPQYDPYSYVYDAQTQLVKEDLSVCSASVNSYLNLNKNQFQHVRTGTAFFPYVQQTAPNNLIRNGGTGRVPHHPHRPQPSPSQASGSSNLENEYEEICDVQKYMNIHPTPDSCPPGLENGCNAPVANASPQDRNTITNTNAINPNPDNTTFPKADLVASDPIQPGVIGGTSGHVKQQSDLSLTSPLNNLAVQGPLPPKHFKSYSTSTDDILAEVVQVQQKHDRVLDQLNLEVENLLNNSADIGLEEKEGLGEKDKDAGLGSYSTLVVTKDEPPPPFPRGSLNFRSQPHSCASSNSAFAAISTFGTFGRKSKQRREIPVDKLLLPSASDDKDLSKDNADAGSKMTLNNEKGKSNAGVGNGSTGCLDSEELFCGTGTTKVKGRYHRSMSLIPNWKIRDHLMRLPFLRSNSQCDKVKKSEGLLPHSHSISGGDFSTLQSNPHNKHSKFAMNPAQEQDSTSNLKNRASSVDELRSTGEEHWYSADSDTEPDSLTAVPPIPPAHSPPADQDASNNPNLNGNVNSVHVNLNFLTQDKSGNLNYQVKGQTFPLVQSVGNLYSNCGDCNGSRMDVGSGTTIGNGIPEVPKAPKFRRPAIGLKDKWRESWSSSSSNPKALVKANSMEEENRLLRWFSLRKNSASANLDGSSTHANGGSHRNSTLPQLTEEDLKRISFMEDEEGYWPRRTVQPPSLPPPPAELTGDQLTRRHIIAAIVHSENSYVAALQRLVNEYKKPLECSHPSIISHSKISAVFHRVPEILQCHSLFRIALAECVRKWDAEEKIGDVFVASFSKSLVLDVYSEFINNFGTAMETAKSEARRKSSFAEFLKVKQMTAHDRLSLFGLMVKPVQRFPQFILLLQDLLKHTPKDHHDRMSLQLALTQLESLAAMLNERKRESEQYQAFRETIKSIGGGKFVLLRNIVDDPNRILLRQDLVTQLEFDNHGSTVAKSKMRKLLLLNDMLICTSVTGSPSESSSLSRKNSCDDEGVNGKKKSEKSVFKWSYPVRDVEVEDISISPTMSRFVNSKNSRSSHPTPNTTEESSMSISLLEEMQALMHDYEVLSRILTHVSTLKSSYEGLTVASVKELMLEIQHQIRCRDEQISYFDSSCLTLLLGSGGNKEKVVFQMQSPHARSAWIEELRLAQLALDSNNSPAWDIPMESPYPLHKVPLFVKAVPLSKQPHLTVVKCGCFFTHTFVSQTGRSKILDYLWVSSTDGMSSHLTAFRSQQNTLKEVSSFDLVEEKVNDMLFVQGFVWVATESRKIMIYDPADTEKGPVAQQILTDAVLKLLFYNNAIFAGLADGHLAVFVQLNFEAESIDKFCPEILLQLGSEKILSLFGSKEHVYAACGNAIVTVNSNTFTVEKSVIINHHNGPISHMACSGVGLWITTFESETVCLYHLESFQHLQDVSIRPSVYRTVRDSFRRSKGVFVTCLIAHKGWLWIGTNLGVILTIPLPRLEGVPIISTGNANVSYHGFCGPVTFLMPLLKNPLPSLLPPKTKTLKSANSAKHGHRRASVDILDNHSTSTPPAQAQNNSSPNSHEGLSSPANDTPETLPDLEDSSSPPEPSISSPLTIEIDVPDKASPTDVKVDGEVSHDTSMSPPTTNGVNLRSRKRKDRDRHPHNNSSSSTSSIENSSPSPNNTQGRNLVVLRKKSSKDSIVQMRNCKTLPRGGPLPANIRFSIDSDVYGLYGNLINVRGLEDEGRFVDPLYDALRRSDPELNSLDAKISTLDRRLKMRMSRPRSLDLSNWSVDSKISASSDDSSIGLHSKVDYLGINLVSTPSDSSPTPPNGVNEMEVTKVDSCSTGETPKMPSTPSATGKKNRQKKSSVPQERTCLVVVGGRGYLNMRAMAQEHFLSTTDTEAKSCPHLTLWQMKT